MPLNKEIKEKIDEKLVKESSAGFVLDVDGGLHILMSEEVLNKKRTMNVAESTITMISALLQKDKKFLKILEYRFNDLVSNKMEEEV